MRRRSVYRGGSAPRKEARGEIEERDERRAGALSDGGRVRQGGILHQMLRERIAAN